MSDVGNSRVRHLLGDDPITDLDSDLFNRGPFADRIVELLDHVADETPSAVLALMGPWGSGKTSVLQILRAKLVGHAEWKVVELNPWMVGDLPSLTDEFFLSLLSVLPTGKKGKRIRSSVAHYAKAVAPLTSPLRYMGLDSEKVLSAVGGLLEGDQSLENRRKEVISALADYGKPILMIADDLDRLQPDELLVMFKLVRLLGRLPNTYYLLAFDEKTALDVLTSTDLAGSTPGRALAYLEKVVQIRLDLPPAHRRSITKLLDVLLSDIMGRYDVDLSPSAAQRLSSMYHAHMASKITEPRHVKRFCAQLEATYPLVKDEVDFVDFLAITFLRTFHPGVVAVLLRHRDELTRSKLDLGKKPSLDEQRKTWHARLPGAGVPDDEVDSLMTMLSELFLAIKSAVERVEHSGQRPERLGERRVDTLEYFDRYFHLGISDSDIEDSQVDAALREVLGGDPGPAWGRVADLVAIDSALVLDKLRRFAPSGPTAAERLAPLVAAFQADIVETGPFGGAEVAHEVWTSELIGEAEPADDSAFVSAIAAVSTIALTARCCAGVVWRAERAGSPLTPAQRRIVAAGAGLVEVELDRQSRLSLPDTDSVLGLLSYWHALDPNVDQKAWLTGVVRSGRWPLPDVLGLFVPVGMVSGGGPSVPALSDPAIDLFDQFMGLKETAEYVGIEESRRMLSDLPPAIDNFGFDRDVSFGNRVQIAIRAFAPRFVRILDEPESSATSAAD